MNHKFQWNFNGLDTQMKWLFSVIIIVKFPEVVAKSQNFLKGNNILVCTYTVLDKKIKGVKKVNHFFFIIVTKRNFNGLDPHRKWLFSLLTDVKVPLVIVISHNFFKKKILRKHKKKKKERKF